MSEEYTGFHGYWIEQWSQFLGGCNWYTFNVFQFEIEDDRHMGGVELTLIVLGLGFRARYNYSTTEHVSAIIERAEQVVSESAVVMSRAEYDALVERAEAQP